MANKRGRLKEEEEFYITNNPKGLTQQELANKFNVAIKTVAGIQQRGQEKKEQEQVVEVAQPQPVQPAEKTMMRQTLISKTGNKGKSGVMIMTKAASERCDEAGKVSRGNSKKNKYDNDFTTKSFPDN